MSDLRSALRERIRSNGPIPFSTFMAEALYHPVDGFYAVHGHAGRRGDFLTSPEVGPLFGALIARYLDRCWEALGQPEAFRFVDLGAGPATLARSIELYEPNCLPVLEYVAVETSVEQRSLHPDWVHSTDELPYRANVLLANELLDNIPFDIVDASGSQRMFVGVDGDNFVEVWPQGRPDVRIPAQNEARQLIERMLDSAEDGFAVVIDYMRPEFEDFVGQPWLRTYRDHERGHDPLIDPGRRDITADIAWKPLVADLIEPRCRTQAEFLMDHGIAQLVAEGKAAWQAGAAQGGLEALRGRSRVAESEALLDPAGLGGFTVLEWDLSEPRGTAEADSSGR